MSLIEEVAASLGEVVDGLPVEAVGRLADQLDHTVGLLAEITEGSGSHRLASAVVAFDRARHAAAEVLDALRAIAEHLDTYRAALGVTASTGPAVVAPQPPVRPVHVDPRALLDELPAWSPGTKTRGIWIDEHGTRHDLLSGRHEEWYQQARHHAVNLRLVRAGTILTVASHVELKFAMRMRQTGIRTATIVINKVPCRERLGCHELLPRFLPEDATLTVYGPDGFCHTYRGRGR